MNCTCGHQPEDHMSEGQGGCLATTDDRGLIYCACAQFSLEGLVVETGHGKSASIQDKVLDDAAAGLGRALRDQGAARVEAAQDDDDAGEWSESVDSRIVTLAKSGSQFTAETVLEGLARPGRPNAVGARFLSARKRGIIQQVGTTTAARGPAHGRILRVWAGA